MAASVRVYAYVWACFVLCCSMLHAHAAYMNDSNYHTTFVRRNCACSSPIHPQARFCGADLVITAILSAVKHVGCNFSVYPSKHARNTEFSCTELHFIASHVLHTTGRLQRRLHANRAVEALRQTGRVVLTIPKSNISTCNFDTRPVIDQTYVVSANFLDKRWYTYSCYHILERWWDLSLAQRRAYETNLYERNCRCQIVQSSSYARVDWPRRPGNTARSRQCWWYPGSTTNSAKFDRTAYCRQITGRTNVTRCEWHITGRIPVADNARRTPITRATRRLAPTTTQATSTMSNDLINIFDNV